MVYPQIVCVTKSVEFHRAHCSGHLNEYTVQHSFTTVTAVVGYKLTVFRCLELASTFALCHPQYC